jgi:hypothetical protein
MTVKEGSYGYRRIFNFKDQCGNPIDLSGMDTVTLFIRVNTGEVIERTCTIIDALNGQVVYMTEEGDFDSNGFAFYEVEASGIGTCYISENEIKEKVKKRIGY